MIDQRTRGTRATRLAVAFLIAAAVLITACGGGTSSSSSSSASTTAAAVSSAPVASSNGFVAQARADVAAAERPLTAFDAPASSPGPIPSGKRLVAITCLNGAPLCLRSAESVLAAAKAVGWQAQLVDGKGTPQTWANAVGTAVSGGASAIVMDSSEPSLVPQQVAQAQQKGIPVVGTLTCENPYPRGVVNEIESDRFKTGYTLGEWVVQHSPSGAQVMLLNSPEFLCLQHATAGFKSALAKAGPTFKIVQQATSPVSDTQGPAGAQRLSAVMRANPQAKYFWVMSESWAGTFQQAAQAAGRTDVTGLGIDGDFFVSQVKSGAHFVMGGPDTREYGYYAVDSLLRYFNHKPQVKYTVPFRILDNSNAASNPGDAIVAGFDFQADWRKLWGR